MRTSETVRWGVIGLGHVAVDCLAPAIAASPGSRLVACAGRDFVRAREIARRIGAERVHRDHEALAADPDVDIIYVATPNALRKDAVLAAARAQARPVRETVRAVH